MSTRAARLIVSVVAIAHGAPAWASGPCQPEWRSYGEPYLNQPVFALTTWESGGKPVVVAGGNFHSAGSTQLNFVGTWNGTEWLAMGDGLSGTVHAATLYDQEGVGSQPVVAGTFTLSGSTRVNRIARFDGTQWVPFGEGVTIPGSTFNATVYALNVHDGWLVVGGIFTQAGSVAAPYSARWAGQSWHAFETDILGLPRSFVSHGGSLYSGGYFVEPGAPSERTGTLRWTGSEWEVLGSNFPRRHVYALSSYNGELYAGGAFWQSGSNPNGPGDFVARFDGNTWHPVGAGLNGTVEAMLVFDVDDTGPRLYVGGAFNEAGGAPASGIASWDGTMWRALGSGTAGRVRALTVWRNQLVVGGEFFSAGGLVSPGMALWGCELPDPPCYADCDASGTLDIDDFLCFIDEFASAQILPPSQQMTHYANCTGATAAPFLNVNDFLCFIDEFAQGCR